MTSVASTPFPVTTTNAERQTTAPSQYDILDAHIKAKNLCTLPITTSDGSVIYLAFKRNFIDDAAKRRFMAILKTIRYRSEDKSMRCQTCIMGFIRYYARMVFYESVWDQDGKTLLSGLPRTHTDLMLLSEAEGLFSTSGTWVIIDGPIGTEFEGGYHHLYVPLPRCELKSFSNKNYNWFIHQHFPTLDRLMSENNNKGIIPSLELLLSLLPKVVYGDKIQKSTEWFLKYMRMYRNVHTAQEREFIVLQALLNQYMVPGLDEEPIVATNLKQTKDTVLMAMSCAHSETALVNFLTKLFNPTTYMRKTSAPTAGSLAVAMNIFKDANFSTTVMTISNLLNKHGGKAPPLALDDQSSSSGDALSVWSGMQNSLEATRTKGKRGGAGGFAQRAGTTAFVAPTTIRELYDRIEEFPGLMIYVSSSSHPVFLSEYPDTASHLIKHPFLWAFQNSSTPYASYGIDTGYHNVIAMTDPDTMGRNVFFGVNGARLVKTNPGNTCFPSFLKEGVQRKAGSAFESLNKSTSATVPKGCGPLALGIGTSRKDSYNGLHSSFSFKYKDHTFSINKW